MTWVGVVGKVGGRGASVEYDGEYCPLGPGTQPDPHATIWNPWKTTTIDSILPNHEIAVTHIIVLAEDPKSAGRRQDNNRPKRHNPPLSITSKELSNCNNSNAHPSFLPQPQTSTGIE